jgi:hypothetical protein
MAKVSKTWSTPTKGKLEDVQALLQKARDAGVPPTARVLVESSYGETDPVFRAYWTE